MRAVVMCGGLGTRLRPLTLSTPKSMLPVAGRPVIDRLLEKLAEAGIQDVTLATGYLAEQIEDFVKSGERWGLRVDYVRQVQPMGTAGALSMLKDKHETVLVANGDKVIETATDIRFLVESHASDVTVGTVRYQVPYGVMQDGKFSEKPTLWTAAGFYVVDGLPRNEIFRWSELMQRKTVDMPAIIRRAKALGEVRFHGWVLDIGTPESYKAACDRLAGS